jgi:hypothetical protein
MYIDNHNAGHAMFKGRTKGECSSHKFTSGAKSNSFRKACVVKHGLSSGPPYRVGLLLLLLVLLELDVLPEVALQRVLPGVDFTNRFRP